LVAKQITRGFSVLGALHAELGVIMDVICPQGQQR
jgi:hypothetical protein